MPPALHAGCLRRLSRPLRSLWRYRCSQRGFYAFCEGVRCLRESRLAREARNAAAAQVRVRHHTRLARHAFRAWKRYHGAVVWRQLTWCDALRASCTALTCSHLLSCNRFTCSRLASEHYNRRLCSKVLPAWRLWAQQHAYAAGRAALAREHCRRATLNAAFSGWVELHNAHLLRQQLNAKALRMWARHMRARHLRAWHELYVRCVCCHAECGGPPSSQAGSLHGVAWPCVAWVCALLQ